MQETINGNAKVIEGLSALCTEDDAIHHSTDSFGNAFHWFRLGTPRMLTRGAEILRQADARLAMVTAYNRRQLSEPMQEVCYHFELDGVVYNMTVTLNGEWPTVPSITPLFANADWNFTAFRSRGSPIPAGSFLMKSWTRAFSTKPCLFPS